MPVPMESKVVFRGRTGFYCVVWELVSYVVSQCCTEGLDPASSNLFNIVSSNLSETSNRILEQ